MVRCLVLITVNMCSRFTFFDFQLSFVRRPVSRADVANTEKRLLQTIDMIINKKKRIALATHKTSFSSASGQSKAGLWSFLKTVSDSVTGSGESILSE